MQAARLRKVFFLALAVLFATGLSAQTALKSPQSVKTGLRIMNQVVGHTGRLIGAKTFQQVPREAGEFADGVAVLREAIAGEPAGFKSKVEPLIDKAVQASTALSEAAKSDNEAALTLTHEQFAAAVKTVIDAFPEDVRPAARTSTPTRP